MTIQIGDRIPDATLTTMTADGPRPVTTAELFGGKTVALFAVPGAFTPTCSARHLPGYVDNRADLAAKGVDTVACLSVNDAFVMGAWAQANGPAAHRPSPSTREASSFFMANPCVRNGEGGVRWRPGRFRRCGCG